MARGFNSETLAIVICDMWDAAQCVSAAQRIQEVAPRINRLASRLREAGALIVHAPAGCTEYYANTPARDRALRAGARRPAPSVGWNDRDSLREPNLPPFLADDTPCSCEPGPACTSGGPPYPWTRQVDAIDIAADDVVTDRGEELQALLDEGRIDDVLVAGVHANRCVLGRPYGIRQLVYWRKRPVLCRDLTDSYHRDPRGHSAGNDAMVAHIEQHWCPTVASEQLLEAFR